MKIIATTAFGLESVCAHEFKDLGYEEVTVENGRVAINGTERDIAKLNMWLRTADRVLWEVASFRATSFEELFQGVKKVCWGDFLPIDAEMHVIGKSVQSKLFSVPDCQAITKKAIVEKMKEKYGIERFEENGATYKISVALLKDIASITIDTSGAGLHKRGYRSLAGDAPLKETLACALINLSYWRGEKILCDPLCGTGTIPIEAAMIALNRAPGLKRSFVCESWQTFSPKLWAETREQANDLIKRDMHLNIYGSDIDPKAIDLARIHAEEAGVDEYIKIKQMNVCDLASKESYGFIITNPPYGERLGDQSEIISLYKTMAQTFERLDNWSYYILTSFPQFETVFGKRSDKRRKLFNGRIECQYYRFLGRKPQREKQDGTK